MAWSWGDAFKGGTQAALLTSKTGNPYVIAGSAIVGALAQGYSSEADKIDPTPYRQAMERLRKSTRGRTNRAKKESSSQMATNLRSRGMAGALGEGIAEGSRRMIQQRSDDYLNEQEANLEMSLADAEVGLERRKSARKRQDTANLGIAALGVTEDIGTADEHDTPFYQSIQRKIGIEPHIDPDSEDLPTEIQEVFDQESQEMHDASDAFVDQTPYQYFDRDKSGNLKVRGSDKGMQSEGDGQFLRMGIDHPLNQLKSQIPKTAQVLLKGEIPYIQPQGSNTAFAADSTLGGYYVINAPAVDYMARNMPGGWEELIEYLVT